MDGTWEREGEGKIAVKRLTYCLWNVNVLSEDCDELSECHLRGGPLFYAFRPL